MKRYGYGVATIVLALLLFAGVGQVAVADGDRCSDPRNLMFNCDFNTFTDYSSGDMRRVVADGWYFWVEEGNPAFEHGQDSPVPPSQQIWSDGGNFRVGIYQSVQNLTPGATYIAGVGWVPYTAPDGSIMRQVGIDPYGGTNALSPNVIWGTEDWRFSRFTNLEVRAVAQTSTITVFIRIYNPASHGADIVFIDGANLLLDTTVPVVPVGGESAPTATPSPAPPSTNTPESLPPTATEVPATPTSAPATAVSTTPTRLPPTNTAAPSSTPIPPTETVPIPTETEEPTATRSIPTETPEPEPTRTRQATRTARATHTLVPSEDTGEDAIALTGELTVPTGTPTTGIAVAAAAPTAPVAEPESPQPRENALRGAATVLAVVGIAGAGGGWLLYRRRVRS